MHRVHIFCRFRKKSAQFTQLAVQTHLPYPGKYLGGGCGAEKTSAEMHNENGYSDQRVYIYVRKAL